LKGIHEMSDLELSMLCLSLSEERRR
jgi:hypothetical protein